VLRSKATQTMSDAVAAQKRPGPSVGVPSLKHCGVAPRLCATGTKPSSRLALTLNLGLQIVNIILRQPLNQLNYEVAKSNLESIEEDLKKTEIYSPISGVIISADKEEGEAISGTNSAAQATTIMTVADLSRMVVEVNINEVDIGKLKSGQGTRIALDAFPEERFKGKVISIAPSSEITEGIVTYLVKVKVAQPKIYLKPGMSAEVEILTTKRENVLLAPQSAL